MNITLMPTAVGQHVRTNIFGEESMLSQVQSTAVRLLWVCTLVLAMTHSAVSQLPTATILGVVKDSSGAVIPGVTLTARNVETGQSRTAISIEDGSYRFAALPVGSYEVRTELPGFQTQVRSGLTLTVS